MRGRLGARQTGLGLADVGFHLPQGIRGRLLVLLRSLQVGRRGAVGRARIVALLLRHVAVSGEVLVAL